MFFSIFNCFFVHIVCTYFLEHCSQKLSHADYQIHVMTLNANRHEDDFHFRKTIFVVSKTEGMISNWKGLRRVAWCISSFVVMIYLLYIYWIYGTFPWNWDIPFHIIKWRATIEWIKIKTILFSFNIDFIHFEYLQFSWKKKTPTGIKFFFVSFFQSIFVVFISQ